MVLADVAAVAASPVATPSAAAEERDAEQPHQVWGQQQPSSLAPCSLPRLQPSPSPLHVRGFVLQPGAPRLQALSLARPWGQRAGPKPVFYVRERCFLPACPAAPR